MEIFRLVIWILIISRFINEFLRERKLRFGIVLNHEKMKFELWLMGQNAGIQKKLIGSF